MEFRGARYLHVLRPCPLGWGSRLDGHDQARAAREGDRALPRLRGRARRGHERLEDPPAGAGRGVPAPAAPLRAPVRATAPRTTSSRASRPRADRNIRRFGSRGRRAPTDDCRHSSRMDEAVRDHARRRLEPAPTRPARWRTERPVYVAPAAAVQRRLPGRREHPAVALRRRGGGDYEAAWRQIMEDNPFPAVMGRVCYHPCETACNRGAARRGRRDQLGRALPRRRGDRARAGASTVDAPPTGKRVLVVGAGPSGLSAAYHLAPARPRGHDPRRRPAGRRHDALRHPALPAAARRPRRRDRADPRPGRDARAEQQGRRPAGRDARGRLRRRLPRGRRAHRQARVHPGRRGGAGSSTRSRCCTAWRARSRRCSAAGSSSTAAATPRWTPRAPPSGSAPRRRSSSTGAPATGCPRTTSRSRRPSEEGVLMQVALDDQARRRRASSWSRGWSSTRPASRSRPASSRSSRPTRVVLALGQDADLVAARRRAGHRGRRRRRRRRTAT